MGGGQTRCIMGDVQMANFQFYFKKVGMLKSEARLRLVGGLWSHCHGRLTLEPLREKLK